MHDAVDIEARGRPVAVIVTAEFLHEAKTQRAALGMETLVPVVIPHPLSTLNEAEIASRAEAAVASITGTWLG